MGFIAVKNKKICPFNNDDEKLDILEFFYDEQCRGEVEIFNNDELEKALNFANVKKISGYALFSNMSNYKKLNKMKRSGFVGKTPDRENRYYNLYISKNHGECFSFIINDIYYLNTNKYLVWEDMDLLIKEYSGPKEEVVKNFENSIEDYAKQTYQDIKTATYQYLITMKRLLGRYPWSILEKGKFKKIDDKIEFSEIFKVTGTIVEKDKIILKKYIRRENIQVADSEICEISETYNEIERQILNEDILDVLRTVNWYYSYWEERK